MNYILIVTCKIRRIKLRNSFRATYLNCIKRCNESVGTVLIISVHLLRKARLSVVLDTVTRRLLDFYKISNVRKLQHNYWNVLQDASVPLVGLYGLE